MLMVLILLGKHSLNVNIDGDTMGLRRMLLVGFIEVIRIVFSYFDLCFSVWDLFFWEGIFEVAEVYCFGIFGVLILVL